MLADRARTRSAAAVAAVPDGPAATGSPRPRSRPVDVAVPCIPLAVVTVLCVGSWLWASGLEQFIGTQYPSDSSMRMAVAAVLTGGVAIAAAATWVALFPGRLSPARLRPGAGRQIRPSTSCSSPSSSSTGPSPTPLRMRAGPRRPS